MSGLSSAVLIVAGITFYVAISHMFLYLRIRERREILFFAISCFFIGFYDLFCAGLYSAEDVICASHWQALQIGSLMLLGIFVIWFVSDLINRKNRVWDIAFTASYILFLVLLAYDHDMFLSEVPAIKSFRLSKLVDVTYNEAQPVGLFFVQGILGIAVGFYVVGSLFKYARAGNTAETKPILIGMMCFMVAVINDTAIGAGMYQSFYLIEYAFIFLIVGMAHSLATTYIQTASALKLSKDELLRLAAAVDCAAESIIVTDFRGAIQYVNPWFETMTGFSRDEIVGKNTRVLSSGKHGKKFYKNLWDTVLSGETWRGHFINVKKDGTFFEENAVISPIKSMSGKITNFVAVKRDVTEEKALEVQVRQSQKMAAIGHLAHKVTHTFTNVLLIILGNAQLAKRDKALSPKTNGYLDEITAAGNRISALTGELLAFAHPAPPAMKKVKFKNILPGIEELLKQSIDLGVNLKIQCGEESGKVEIDISQIEQVVVHLAINATDAMPDGGDLVVTAERANLSKEEEYALGEGRHNGSFAVLEVSDTGCGMDEETLSHIFEPFFSTKDSRYNPGLGLSTIYSIVDQHRGVIKASSEPGEGSIFRVYLPLLEG